MDHYSQRTKFIDLRQLQAPLSIDTPRCLSHTLFVCVALSQPFASSLCSYRPGRFSPINTKTKPNRDKRVEGRKERTQDCIFSTGSSFVTINTENGETVGNRRGLARIERKKQEKNVEHNTHAGRDSGAQLVERRRARYAVSATRNSGWRFKGKASPRRRRNAVLSWLYE